MKKGLFIVFFLSILGCSEEQNETGDKYSPVLATASDASILMPKSLIAKVEKQYLANFKLTNPYDVRSDAQVMARVPRHFLNLTVWLEAQGGRALDDNYKFQMPRGGGVIDLSDFVTKGRGNFLFKAKLKQNVEGEEVSVAGAKVYFVSHAKKRKIGKSYFGAGCGTTIDVTHFFNMEISGEGLLLNTTDQRYLSVLGGTFFFVYIEKAQLNFASLQIRDGRYSQYTCFPTLDT